MHTDICQSTLSRAVWQTAEAASSLFQEALRVESAEGPGEADSWMTGGQKGALMTTRCLLKIV